MTLVMAKLKRRKRQNRSFLDFDSKTNRNVAILFPNCPGFSDLGPSKANKLTLNLRTLPNLSWIEKTGSRPIFYNLRTNFLIQSD